MSTTFDIASARLAALKRDAEQVMIAAQPLLTTAPDTRPSTDCEHPDPTADIVLHPKRMAVAEAYSRVQKLHTCLTVVEHADDLIVALEDAINAWHGRDAA